MANARNILNSKTDRSSRKQDEEASATEKQKWETEVLGEWKQNEQSVWRAQKVLLPDGGKPMVGIRKFFIRANGKETVTGQGILIPFDKEVNEVLDELTKLLTLCGAGRRKIKGDDLYPTSGYILRHRGTGRAYGMVSADGMAIKGVAKKFKTSDEAKAFRAANIKPKHQADFQVKKVTDVR